MTDGEKGVQRPCSAVNAVMLWVGDDSTSGYESNKFI